MTEAHYVWVGPKKKLGDDFIGMDTMGAELMASHYPDETIVFWCLAAEADAYKAHFKEQGNVEVRAIEPWVQSIEGDDGPYTQFVSNLQHRAHQLSQSKATRAKAIYEWILIKESFFYWAAQHIQSDTAFLDSSIVPDHADDEGRTVFDAFDRFSTAFIPGLGSESPDPWLMLAKAHDPEATTRFEQYFKEVKVLLGDQLEPRHHGHAQSERVAICNQFALASKHANPLLTTDHGKHAHAVMGVKKTYLNTHRLEDMAGRPTTWWGKQPLKSWAQYRHWVFRYLESNDTQALSYLFRKQYFSPHEKLPYAAHQTDQQINVSPIHWTRLEIQSLQKMLQQNRRNIERAKRILMYDKWHWAIDLSKLNSAFAFSQLQFTLAKDDRFRDLGFTTMDNGEWQTHLQTILYGEKSIQTAIEKLRVRSKQYAMLLAFSDGSNQLELAASCAAPEMVLDAYFKRTSDQLSAGDPTRCFTTLNQLYQKVLLLKGYRKIEAVSSLESATDGSLKYYRTAWTTAHFTVLQSMLHLMTKEGFPSPHNKDRYMACMYRHTGNVHAFFNQEKKKAILADLSACLDTLIDADNPYNHGPRL